MLLVFVCVCMWVYASVCACVFVFVYTIDNQDCWKQCSNYACTKFHYSRTSVIVKENHCRPMIHMRSMLTSWWSMFAVQMIALGVVFVALFARASPSLRFYSPSTAASMSSGEKSAASGTHIGTRCSYCGHSTWPAPINNKKLQASKRSQQIISIESNIN